MNTTIIVVDARSREQKVFTASVTQVRNGSNLVLRKGVEIGKVRMLQGQKLEYPVLIVGAYSAKSSAGFVSPITSGNFDSVYWVGGAGFGADDGRGSGLRPFGWPLESILLPAGTVVSAVETHGNSNTATADAALAGLRMRVNGNRHLLILAEGQSDYVSATSFKVSKDAERPEFSEEHRGDVFSSENMFNAMLRRRACGDEGLKNLLTATLRAVLRAGKSVTLIGLSKSLRLILSDSELRRVVEEKTTALEAEGWKFGFDVSLANHFTRALSPDGAVVNGNALFDFPEVEETFLSLSTLNTEEEVRNMRISKVSGTLMSRFWYNWGCDMIEGRSIYDHDVLVVAEFDSGSESLWFAHSDNLGPNGEAKSGSRFISAFDSRGMYLWDRLLEVKRLTTTAYSRTGEKVSEYMWPPTQHA